MTEFAQLELTEEDLRNLTGHLSFTALLKFPSQGFDANLKLALEAELDRLGRRDHGVKFDALHSKWDEDDNNNQDLDEAGPGRDCDIYQAVKSILSLPFRSEDLEAVESLEWGHGTQMIYWIDPNWGGEDDFFEIGTLNGLEACKNLRSLEIVWQTFTDITSLAQLTKLESAYFEFAKFDVLEPLLQLPSLKSLTMEMWCADATKADYTLKCLRDRGVRVQVSTL